MFNIDNIIDIPPFSFTKQKKYKLYQDALHNLTKHHYKNCYGYRKILDTLLFNPNIKHNIEEIPFIPARLFKTNKLLSVDTSEIIKTITSSGTTGQKVSEIFLDKATAHTQRKALNKIVSDLIGNKKLPMLMIDTQEAIKNRNLFSARGAGILGFSLFGYDITYALDKNMNLDLNRIETFCNKHKNKKILLFGFTYIIWEHFYKKLIESNKRIPLDNGILIHGGGWKKMTEKAVNNNLFKKKLKEICGIEKNHNYYGMVEQAGSIFMECEKGYFHSSIFSDIIIRDTNFLRRDNNKTGIIQLLSLLPSSYPGHNILSEDIGEIIGEDDCKCGRLGKYFKIHGRIKNSEIRGCSDTYTPTL